MPLSLNRREFYEMRAMPCTSIVYDVIREIILFFFFFYLNEDYAQHRFAFVLISVRARPV